MTITKNLPLARRRLQRAEDQLAIVRALTREWRHETDLLDELDIPATRGRWAKAILGLVDAGEIDHKADEQSIEPGGDRYYMWYRLADGR